MDATQILADARSALCATAQRTAELVRSLPDANVPVPDSEWTVRDHAIHLYNYGPVYADIARGTPSPVKSLGKEPVWHENRGRLDDVAETDPEKVARLIEEGVADLLEATAGRAGDQPVVFHAGLSADVAGLVCCSLAEQVLHGYDMATAIGRPWPIDPAYALLVLYGFGQCFGGIVNLETSRGVTAAYGVGVRGGAQFTVRFTDGVYSAEPFDSGPVDCTISADPVGLLLTGTGRMNQWQAIALGLIKAGGARPEMAPGFLKLFVYP